MAGRHTKKDALERDTIMVDIFLANSKLSARAANVLFKAKTGSMMRNKRVYEIKKRCLETVLMDFGNQTAVKASTFVRTTEGIAVVSGPATLLPVPDVQVAVSPEAVQAQVEWNDGEEPETDDEPLATDDVDGGTFLG